MWMVIRRFLTIIAYCLNNQRFQNCFERDWNLSLVNILRPKPQTAYVNMTKILIVWMIFGSRLLSWLSMSAFDSFLKCLRYTTNRHRKADTFEKIKLRFWFWSPRRDLLSGPSRNCLRRDPYCGNHWRNL